MESHACHASFVLFVRTVDVEVAQTDDWGAQILHFAAQNLVEKVLGVPVDVQRTFVTDVFDELLMGTVGSGGGGIDEGHAKCLSPAVELKCVAVVVLHHVVAVVLHGVGAGALMKDGFRLRRGATADAVDEVAFVKVVRDAALGEVLVLFAAFQIVDGDDVGDAAFIESENVVATDETGSAGN